MTKERRQIKEFSWVQVELQVEYEVLSQNESMSQTNIVNCRP